MPRKYVPVDPSLKAEGKARRLRAHYHNRLMGYATMSERQMLEIVNSDTTTDETKDIAATILAHLRELRVALKTRRD